MKSSLMWVFFSVKQKQPAALDLPILRKKIQIDIQNTADSLRRISPAALDLLILRKKKIQIDIQNPAVSLRRISQ